MSRTRSFRPAALFARPTLAFLTLLIALVLSGFSARQANAFNTYYVATVSAGNGSGSSWSNASSNLQGIITAAHSGDQVWVKYGVYTGNFTATDGVAVYGHFAGNETSTSARMLTNSMYTTYLDANGSGTVYTIPTAATGTNTLNGFTVESGTNRGLSDPSSDHLVLTWCTVTNNTASYYSVTSGGGGVYTHGVSAILTSCTFTSNTAGGEFGTLYGGGFYADNGSATTTITDCYFSANGVSLNGGNTYGGGIYTSGTATISNCTITGNSAGTSDGGIGAGGSAVTITGCTINTNPGGGVGATANTITISGCTFDGNSGRGVTVSGPSESTINTCTFTNNKIEDANGGGLYAGSLTNTITGCTFSGNSTYGETTNLYGGGVYTASGTTSTISKCIFIGNSESVNGGSLYGGGVCGFGTPSIVDCTFMNNSPDQIDLENAGTSSAPVSIKDSLIVENGDSAKMNNGIDLAISGGSASVYATIANNTIVDTNVGINIGTGSGTGGAVSVANNILDGNNGGLNDYSSVAFTSSHNDIYGNTNYGYNIGLSASDLTVDPMFVRNPNFTSTPADYGDQHLKPGSPLLNAGDVSYVSSGDTALDGNDRTVNNKVDIGSYEGTIDPEPSITSFAPMSGPVGTVVTITGTNLAGVTSVLFDGTAATVFSVNAGGTQVTATVPSGAATGTIFITAATGSVPTATPFTISSTPATPTITSFTPTSGPVGIVVTATGTNLAGVTAVMFSGASATTFSANAAGTMLTVTVPTGAGTGAFTVTTPNGSVQTSTAFTVTSAAPTITSFSPTSGPVGTSVVITGTNFTGAAVVGFTGAHASFTVNSATQITATVPSGATTGPIAVATAGGTAHSSASFTVTGTTPAPTITSFTPTSGPIGTTVTITGTNFTGATVVGFTGAHATFTVNSATQITATVPTGATTGPIAVQTAGGTAHSSASFTVIVMLPTVQSLAFSPSAIAPGASSTGTVTLSGPAPTGGSVVTILLDSFTFDTVTVAAGHTTGTFTATASATAPAGAYVFTASYNSTSKSATLTVN